LTYNENLQPTAQVAKHPIHPMLVPFPIACFIGVLATDAFQAKTNSLPVCANS
jgi:uncharacterized membrane protein